MGTKPQKITAKEKHGIISIGSRLAGNQIKIATSEIKKIKEDFPEITITLTGNKKIRISGHEIPIKTYTKLMESLRNHEQDNKLKNKEQNQGMDFTGKTLVD